MSRIFPGGQESVGRVEEAYAFGAPPAFFADGQHYVVPAQATDLPSQDGETWLRFSMFRAASDERHELVDQVDFLVTFLHTGHFQIFDVLWRAGFPLGQDRIIYPGVNNLGTFAYVVVRRDGERLHLDYVSDEFQPQYEVPEPTDPLPPPPVTHADPWVQSVSYGNWPGVYRISDTRFAILFGTAFSRRIYRSDTGSNTFDSRDYTTILLFDVSPTGRYIRHRISIIDISWTQIPWGPIGTTTWRGFGRSRNMRAFLLSPSLLAICCPSDADGEFTPASSEGGGYFHSRFGTAADGFTIPYAFISIRDDLSIDVEYRLPVMRFPSGGVESIPFDGFWREFYVTGEEQNNQRESLRIGDWIIFFILGYGARPNTFEGYYEAFFAIACRISHPEARFIHDVRWDHLPGVHPPGEGDGVYWSQLFFGDQSTGTVYATHTDSWRSSMVYAITEMRYSIQKGLPSLVSRDDVVRKFPAPEADDGDSALYTYAGMDSQFRLGIIMHGVSRGTWTGNPYSRHLLWPFRVAAALGTGEMDTRRVVQDGSVPVTQGGS